MTVSGAVHEEKLALSADYRERFVDDIVKVFGVREELRLTARVDGYVVLAASGYEPVDAVLIGREPVYRVSVLVPFEARVSVQVRGGGGVFLKPVDCPFSCLTRS